MPRVRCAVPFFGNNFNWISENGLTQLLSVVFANRFPITVVGVAIFAIDDGTWMVLMLALALVIIVIVVAAAVVFRVAIGVSVGAR